MANIKAKDLQKLAELRCKEALILHGAKSYSGAYYLVGYAIELAIKAVISKQFKTNVFPDKALATKIFSHKFADLINLAGLGTALKTTQDANPEFHANWAVILDWSEDSRYTVIDPFRANSMISAVISNPNGVFPWLKTHW